MLDFLATIVVKGLKSKTLFVAWLTFAAGLLSYVSGADVIQQYPQVVSVVATVLGVVQLVLRYVTTVPLSKK